MDLPLRQQIRDTLLRTTVPALHAFADAILAREGDRVACWGNLADYVLAHIERDDDRIALWGALVEVGDRRSLLVFLDLNRDRPKVIRAALEDVSRLPVTIQRALVSMAEAEPHLKVALPHLGPAALELVADAEACGRDRTLYEAHMSALRAQRAAAPCRLSLDIDLSEASEALTHGDLP
jgi:hypothetical protein